MVKHVQPPFSQSAYLALILDAVVGTVSKVRTDISALAELEKLDEWSDQQASDAARHEAAIRKAIFKIHNITF